MLLPLIHPVGHSLQVSWTTLRSMSNIQSCSLLYKHITLISVMDSILIGLFTFEIYLIHID